MNQPQIHSQRTFCRICEAHCGLIIEKDEYSTIQKFKPDSEHTISAGFVCAKGLRFADIADHAERITAPQIRDSAGKLQSTTWDDTYALIRERLRNIIAEHGVHAVAIYFGTPMIHNSQLMLALYQWLRALKTRNLYSAASQDNANKFTAQEIIHNSQWMMPIMDIENADFALLLGTNPVVSQGTFVHAQGGTKAYDAFIKRGGEMVIVDPRHSESARHWGEHIAIKPETDAFLLLGILNELRTLERNPERYNVKGMETLIALAEDYPLDRVANLTDIEAERIQELAIKLHLADKATIFSGVGINQGKFGTLCLILIQAIAYITGNFDAQGGILFNRWANILQILVGLKPQRSRIGDYVSGAGGLPCGILADEIMTEGEGQIRALIVIGGNPLTSVANEAKLRQAFEQLDLLVSVDIFENQTGQLADVILPGTTWLERFDIGAWDAMYETAPMLQTTARVRRPIGDTRTESRIIAELSIASGKPIFSTRLLAGLWAKTDWDGLLPILLKPVQWLFRTRDGIPWRAPRAGTYRGQRKEVLNFWHERLKNEPRRLKQFAEQLETNEAENTLILLGRRRRLAQNSWIHSASREEKASESTAWLNPDDMQRFALSDGDMITIRSKISEIVLPVKADDSIMSGTIVVPHGLPDVNINRLISSDVEHIEPVSGMHQMNGHRVAITKN